MCLLHTVVIETTASAPTFRGFLIQPRLVADDTTVVGRFEEPSPGADYRYSSCGTNQSVCFAAISFPQLCMHGTIIIVLVTCNYMRQAHAFVTYP